MRMCLDLDLNPMECPKPLESSQKCSNGPIYYPTFGPKSSGFLA